MTPRGNAGKIADQRLIGYVHFQMMATIAAVVVAAVSMLSPERHRVQDRDEDSPRWP